MPFLLAIAMAGLLLTAGCGGGEPSAPPPAPAAAPVTGTTATAAKPAAKAEPTGTRIVLDESPFGEMLFDADRQAIYIFERDEPGKSNCYDDCAEAWPPVLTRGAPAGGSGIDAALLGTTERRDGSVQVTYDGQPLYYYAHEAPGEVKCHNVQLNGGFWWVVGADGKRLP